MRSRVGDGSISLRFLSLILFFSLVLSASEYLVSYRYVVKDSLLYNDYLKISKAMQKCHGSTYRDEVIFDINNSDNLEQIIKQNSDEFIEYIHKLGLHIKNVDINQNYQNSNTTVLTLKTTCFKVDFNENLVKIAPIK